MEFNAVNYNKKDRYRNISYEIYSSSFIPLNMPFTKFSSIQFMFACMYVYRCVKIRSVGK